MYALVDCTSFYVSCEVAMQPRLVGKPVVVLGNNDGCIVALNQEAKALGLLRGAPIHQFQQIVDKQVIEVFSSNYPLYGDFSARVMTVLGRFSHAQEIYSVDECFLDVSAVAPTAHHANCLEMQHTVKKWLGLPITVGVGPTRTLAKVAQRLSKQAKEGVLALADMGEVTEQLRVVPVEDVWGIGPRSAEILRAHHIYTAKQLADAPDRWIKKYLHLPGLRTAWELRGISCLPLDLAPAPKQQLACCRAFGRPVDLLKDVQEALAAHVTRAAEKLRAQHSLANVLSIFIATNPFQQSLPQYHRSATTHLAAATNDTSALIGMAHRMLERIYRSGVQYHRAGVFLAELVPDTHRQLALFPSDEHTEKRQAVMEVMDAVNARFGRNTLRPAAAGIEQAWRGKHAKKSPSYTTKVSDLLTVN
jgi:DNA polymerase V